MRTRTLPTVLITLAAGLIVLAVGVLAFIYSGIYNIAATGSHLGIVRWALNTTQTRSVEVRAAHDTPDPPAADQEMVVHGFKHFEQMCVTCHGAPGVERGEFGHGLNPTPPDLSRMAQRYTPRELFWIVENGLKMAGMPAFGPTHSEQEIWRVVYFLERLPGMGPKDYARWVERYGSGEGDGHGNGHGAAEDGASAAESDEAGGDHSHPAG